MAFPRFWPLVLNFTQIGQEIGKIRREIPHSSTYNKFLTTTIFTKLSVIERRYLESFCDEFIEIGR